MPGSLRQLFSSSLYMWPCPRTQFLNHHKRRHPIRMIYPSHINSLFTIATTTFPLHSPLVYLKPSNFSMDPSGTIVFSTVGVTQYGFDIFSVKLPNLTQRRLTDGVSINFNGQFLDENEESLVFVSERSGSPRIYLSKPELSEPELLPSPPESLFHDRPVIKNQRAYFISAHEEPDKLFKSWSALYSTRLDDKKVRRLTPPGVADYSPSVSQSGKFIAVASYGSRDWSGEFHELQTDIVVFPESDQNARVTVCQHGGWPTWSGDSTIYFHRQSDDGWWSIYRVDLPQNSDLSDAPYLPVRVTPAGVHCFTPAAMHNAKKLAVATRRREKSYRQIEIFDAESKSFYPVTETLSPKFHCYNPFFSPDSTFLGYHRFRGESAQPGESIVPFLEKVSSPIKGLEMLRLNGNFPTFSPSGEFIAYTPDFEANSGLKVIKSDGSKRWVLFRNRVTFYLSWSPVEKNVIFTSIGPIFQSSRTTVQIARVTFDPANLTADRDAEIPVDIKILTNEDTGNNAFPSCSPDGKFIVFRSGRSGHKNLYIVDAVNGEFNGGSIRRLTDGPWIDTMPSWSPDGKWIAFSSNMHNPDDVEHFSIYVIGADGSGLRRIRIAGNEGSGRLDRERLNHVCWSADCEWLLFTANLGGVTAEPVSLPNQFQPYGDLYMVRVDGTGLRRLTWNGYENGTPAWYPTGGDVELDMGRLMNLKRSETVGDKLKGDFIEPLWLH
ncbi:unnamed protein product [Coffea canephora]|uniref:Dipeptidylpeptidase IV N-terminal domain-containing protein n=1 Tax=Coffea canephora TaxID=49390 RepID=A0A068TZU7_COFCA|nr:unnamed protein product [Coffea canephora]